MPINNVLYYVHKYPSLKRIVFIYLQLEASLLRLKYSLYYNRFPFLIFAWATFLFKVYVVFLWVFEEGARGMSLL